MKYANARKSLSRLVPAGLATLTMACTGLSFAVAPPVAAADLPLFATTFRFSQSMPLLWNAPATQGDHQPCLTAAGTAQPGSLPACKSGKLDANGVGAFRITGNGEAQSGALILNKAIPTKWGLKIEFDMFQYDAKLWADKDADGMSFFLINGAEANPQPGDPGGGLSYKNLKSAFVGIGFDQYGNFSNPISTTATGRQPNFTTGPGQRPNNVVVRGADTTSYAYLQGVQSPVPLGAPSAKTRDTALRHVVIKLQNNVLNVTIATAKDNSDAKPVITNLTLAGPGMPATVKMGFGGSTGKGTSIHEIRDFLVNKVTA